MSCGEGAKRTSRTQEAGLGGMQGLTTPGPRPGTHNPRRSTWRRAGRAAGSNYIVQH